MMNMGGTANKHAILHSGVAVVNWTDETTNLEACLHRYNYAGTSADFRVNGTELGATALAHQVAPTGHLTLGDSMTGGTYGSNVDMLEWWGWNRRLSDHEAALLDLYAYNRYGV